MFTVESNKQITELAEAQDVTLTAMGYIWDIEEARGGDAEDGHG